MPSTQTKQEKEKEIEHQQFVLASKNERQKLNYFLNNNPDFNLLQVTSAEGYDTFDAYAISGISNYNWAVEVKVRTFSKNKYSTAYIKVDKHKAIMNKINQQKYIDKNVQPMYFMFYTCGKVAIWNLNHTATGDILIKRYRQYNVIDSPIVDNEVYELQLSEATIYNWKQIN